MGVPPPPYLRNRGFCPCNTVFGMGHWNAKSHRRILNATLAQGCVEGCALYGFLGPGLEAIKRRTLRDNPIKQGWIAPYGRRNTGFRLSAKGIHDPVRIAHPAASQSAARHPMHNGLSH
jgi:hypothetical protein